MFKYHKTLAPRIWESRMRMNPLVVQALQMLGGECVRYLGDVVGMDICVADVRDMYVHGSITNYYWDKYSDIDLCVVADLSRMRAALGNLSESALMKPLMRGWRGAFFISIFGRSVDVKLVDYRDVDNLQHKDCMYGPYYSLFRDSWVRTPVRIPDDELRLMRRVAYKKYRAIMRQSRYLLYHKKSAEFVGAYMAGLQQIRRRSMSRDLNQPITSITMAFKMIRNRGMFRRLRNYAKQARSNTYQLD